MIFVVAEHVGELGGGAKSPLLLCEVLAEIGHQVHLFVVNCPSQETRFRLRRSQVKVTTAPLIRGSRFQVGWWTLALSVWWSARVSAPCAVIIYSLSGLAKLVLRLRIRGAKVFAWECTEGLKGIKFVDESISPLLKRVTAVLAPSKQIERNLRNTYRYAGNVHLLPFWSEGPALSTDSKRTRTNRFLYIGRFDREKGLEILVRAFEEVARKSQDAKLLLCGSGEQEWVRRIARHACIEVRGPVVGTEFEDAFVRSDVFVLPSFHEGYPLSLLEACARSHPIIATSVGAVPEVYAGRRCALLIEPGRVKELASAMEQVLGETDELYSIRSADALDLFQSISCKRVILQHIQELVGAPRR